ncbi:MAG: hypothetical protein SGPRY_003147, partial [Prymnesium sp.]
MEERYQHLDVCHALFACCSLRVVGQNLQHAVFSVLPGSHSIEDGVLRVDEEPVSSIVERARHQDEIAEWRAKWAAFTPFPQARTSAPSLGYGLPLRSQAPWHSKSSATAKGKGGPGKGSRLAQKRPPPANAEGLSAPVGPPAPGSQVAAFTWIEPGKELYVSGYVWFIGPVAKKLRVHTQSKCWPTIIEISEQEDSLLPLPDVIGSISLERRDIGDNPSRLLASSPLFGWLASDVGILPSAIAGDTNFVDVPRQLKLPHPQLPAAAATAFDLLPPTLVALAEAASPGQILVDFGGGGQCGPNTLAGLLRLMSKYNGSGSALRGVVAAYAQTKSNQQRLTNFKWNEEPERRLTLGELVVESMKAWPAGFRRGNDPPVENWAEIILSPTAWTDLAFVQVVSDFYSVCVAITGVDDVDRVLFPMFVIEPTNEEEPDAWLEVGNWVGRHFVGLIHVTDRAEAEPSESGGSPMLAGVTTRFPSRKPPISDILTLDTLMASSRRPTVLVGFEFSGAVRRAVEESGRPALSVDFRDAEDGGLHYRGDVRSVLTRYSWEQVFLFPPCFQHLRADTGCLPFKLTDGRCFWAMALVLWCLVTPRAHQVVVEQADTLVYDFIDWMALPDVEVVSFRTSALGDPIDKFVRLFLRNTSLMIESHDIRRRPDLSRKVSNFNDPDARDRWRSSWSLLPSTAKAVAQAPEKSPLPYQPPPLSYLWIVSVLAFEWCRRGFALPQDFDNADAQPSAEDARLYQLTRGPGDGRSVDHNDDAAHRALKQSRVPSATAGSVQEPPTITLTRITEGGGPRQPTFDAAGLQAISINDASHIHHIPAYWLEDSRPEFLNWIEKRGLSDKLRLRAISPPLPFQPRPAIPTQEGKRISKFPKEIKPTLVQLMRYLAVPGHAAAMLDEDIYVFGDDAKDYFNQMAMAVSELWKLNFVFLARKGDRSPSGEELQPPEGMSRLLHIAELRLGFGTHGASNIAQRWSDALLELFRDAMDELEEEALRSSQSSPWKEWILARLSLTGEDAEDCHVTGRWANAEEASLTRLARVQVCPQARLYAALMYTDDPVFVVVGKRRMLRALRAWRLLTNRAKLIMAIPEKRSIGSWA